MDEYGTCPDCGGNLCEHGCCEADCFYNTPDECDCWTWAESLSLSDRISQALADQEPTHAIK